MAEERAAPVCLIATGGTAGHVLPGLAVGEALRDHGARVTFAGSPGRFEAKLVPDAGFEFDAFEVEGLPRRPGLAQIRAAMRSAGAVRTCRGILKHRQPDVVLGGGGYASGPMVLAAAGQRIPTALMEADAHLGLANRLAAPLASRVFLSFPIPGRDSAKYRVTGRPIPASSRTTLSKEDARARFFFEQEPVLLVVGGSQGARSLNELAVESFGDVGPQVLHLSGERDFRMLAAEVSRPGYRLLPFLPDLGVAYAAADLVLARAGGSVWEIAAAQRPVILVPYPFATADHQTENARFFERAGGAVIVPESDLGRVPEIARSLLGDPVRLGEMGAAMGRVARHDAAEDIAKELLDLAAPGR